MQWKDCNLFNTQIVWNYCAWKRMSIHQQTWLGDDIQLSSMGGGCLSKSHTHSFHCPINCNVECLSPKFTHLESHCHWLLLISGRCEGLFLTTAMRWKMCCRQFAWPELNISLISGNGEYLIATNHFKTIVMHFYMNCCWPCRSP